MVRSYQTKRMEAHESIHAFYERFTKVIHTLETYGCPLDPEHIQARHFLQQLDKVRYGRFLTDLQNLVSSAAIPAYPITQALAKERASAVTLKEDLRELLDNGVISLLFDKRIHPLCVKSSVSPYSSSSVSSSQSLLSSSLSSSSWSYSFVSALHTELCVGNISESCSHGYDKKLKTIKILTHCR